MDGLITNAEEGKFVLKDIVYDITDVYFYAEFRDTEIILSIDLNAETNDDEVEYDLSSIRLYHENGFNTHAATFEALKGKIIELELDPDADEPTAGSLYVLEHEDITKGTIEITDVSENTITIHWSGLANVYWDEQYGEDVPFDAVFTVDIPQNKLYAMDLFKSESTKIDSDTVLDVLNLEEFNKALSEFSVSRQRNELNAVLKFKVTHNGEEYFGEVTFTKGKNDHTTHLDENCPIKVKLVSLDFNLSVDYERLSFEIE